MPDKNPTRPKMKILGIADGHRVFELEGEPARLLLLLWQAGALGCTPTKLEKLNRFKRRSLCQYIHRICNAGLKINLRCMNDPETGSAVQLIYVLDSRLTITELEHADAKYDVKVGRLIPRQDRGTL